jgi:hypothetical protein
MTKTTTTKSEMFESKQRIKRDVAYMRQMLKNIVEATANNDWQEMELLCNEVTGCAAEIFEIAEQFDFYQRCNDIDINVETSTN